MSARQLIVLVIAAIAAVGALLLIRSMGSNAPAPTADAGPPIAGEQILVAGRDVAQGAALTPSDLAVALFPEGTISPSFIRVSAQPSAQAEYVGAVTRRAFARGEPITTGSVVQPDGHGFLAAQLQPGYRAVAIEIQPSTSAGGYIQPNDHVDVIVTARADGAGGRQVTSSIVVQDVRVLALGDKTQPQTTGEAPETIAANVAVLELTAAGARAVALADMAGDLSLALRGVEVETVGLRSDENEIGSQGGGVKVHSFGNVVGGGQ